MPLNERESQLFKDSLISMAADSPAVQSFVFQVDNIGVGDIDPGMALKSRGVITILNSVYGIAEPLECDVVLELSRDRQKQQENNRAT